jgi:mannose/fructose-specific phosphotransferase system component IIA
MGFGATGILVTHGALGRELLATAESILGPQDAMHAVSNTDASLELLSQEIRGHLEAAGDRPVFLFVDLLGGSCEHAGQGIRKLRPDAIVFSGVNLPMLLEFLYHRHRVPTDELKERVLTKGRNGIRCFP